MKKWLIFIAITFLFYGVSLRYGFSQDDFYFLLISHAGSFQEVLNFFSPWYQKGFPFYRPLGTQFYFYIFNMINIGKNIFQTSYLMHIFMLIIQASNGYLVYKLLKKLQENEQVSFFVGLMYSIAATHFLSLFYIAATQQLLAAFFSLLSFNAFFSKKSFLTGLFFLLALLSKENAIILPGIIFLALQLQKKSFKIKFSELIYRFFPFIIITIFYLILRFSAGIQVQSTYQPDFSLSLISTLRWYYLFTFNFPEELLQFATSPLTIDYYAYVRDFGFLALINTISSLILTSLSLFYLAKLLIHKTKHSIFTFFIYISWWLLGIFLIIWFPLHRYPHYLDLALIPFFLMLIKNTKLNLRIFVFILFLISSFTAINISISHHWTTKRAIVSTKVINYFATHKICQHDSIYFIGTDNSPQELSYALSLANGPKIICNNSSLEVYYQGMSTEPSNSSIRINIQELLK